MVHDVDLEFRESNPKEGTVIGSERCPTCLRKMEISHGDLIMYWRAGRKSSSSHVPKIENENAIATGMCEWGNWEVRTSKILV